MQGLLHLFINTFDLNSNWIWPTFFYLQINFADRYYETWWLWCSDMFDVQNWIMLGHKNGALGAKRKGWYKWWLRMSTDKEMSPKLPKLPLNQMPLLVHCYFTHPTHPNLTQKSIRLSINWNTIHFISHHLPIHLKSKYQSNRRKERIIRIIPNWNKARLYSKLTLINK